MGFLSRMLARRAEVGPPIRDLRRDRVDDARMEGDRRFRAEQDRLANERDWNRREDDRRRLNDEQRYRDSQRHW